MQIDEKTKQKIICATVIVSRVVFGCVFLFSGFVKAIDPVGSAYKFNDYFAAFGLSSLNIFSLPLAFLVAAFEFLLGANTLLGSYKKATPLFDLVFMLFMTPLTLYLAIANPVSDCGCFGDALILSNWETFFKNILLLAMAVALLRYNTRVKAIYDDAVQGLASLYVVLFSFTISAVGSHYEPMLDFRPYKNGINITEAMTVPEDASGTKYRTTLIYEKDGKKQSFLLEELPELDSTWTFVKTINEEISKGYEPLIKDFSVLSQQGEDITENLLTDENYAFWMIAPSLKDADDNEIDRLNELYDYCAEHGYKFICLTASNAQESNEWRDNTGAEYDYAFADKKTLATILRSNPGIMLVKDGTIYWKSSSHSLPDEWKEGETLDKTNLGQIHTYNPQGRLLFLLLALTLPLLILFLTEKGVKLAVIKFREKRHKRHAKASGNSEKDENNPENQN